MILYAQPILTAEERLEKLFPPAVNEDSIYEMAMLVYEDETVARKLVKSYAETVSAK